LIESNEHRGLSQFLGNLTNLIYQALVSAMYTIEKTYCRNVPLHLYKLQN